MGGNYVFKSSTFGAQKALIRDAIASTRYLRAAGNAVGFVGVALTIGDIAINGRTTSNSIDLAMGAVSFVPGWGWIAGGVYFISNSAIKASTGKDIGQHFDDLYSASLQTRR